MLLIEGWIKLGAGEFEKVRAEGIAMVAATNEEAGYLKTRRNGPSSRMWRCA